MTAAELIEVLSELDPEAEVLLAIVSRSEEDEDELATDLYPIGGIIPLEEGEDEEEEGPTVWLVGGEDDDVEALFEGIEEED